MLANNRLIVGVIGVGAFIIGGLMSRQTAIEGLELVDEKIDQFKHRNDPPSPSDIEASLSKSN